MSEVIKKQELYSTTIKVIGIGGAGGNVVNHMIQEGVRGVEFIVADTDEQALKRSVAPMKLRLGKTVLGAGGKIEVGRDVAISEREQIAETLKGAHMIFIIAGMGGGAGTGVAPVIAEVAHQMDIYIVAVVTKPFTFEGERAKAAESGIVELQKHVNSLIVILNDRLTDVSGYDVSSVDEAFKAADNVMSKAVGGIAEIINCPGLINVDFEDVRTVMGETSVAVMGSASASGINRARLAAEQSIAWPLLEGVVNLSSARGVLVNITASQNLKMKDIHEVMSTVREFAADDAHIIFGAVYDEDIDEELRVTMIVTESRQSRPVETPVFLRRGNKASALRAILGGNSGDAESDPLYDQAVDIVLKNRRVSISLVQRHLRIGYNRSERLIETMEKAGLVSPMDARGGREILADADCLDVARNPGTSPDRLQQLVGDRNEWVCIAVAKNPNTPPATLLRLLNEPNSISIRASVAGNPNTPSAVLRRLAGEDQNGSAPRMRMRVSVAGNPNAPPEVLQQLAGDLSEDVCRNVAGNPNTPSITLQKLAGDLNKDVRRNVARNPNVPPDVLAVLALDMSRDVQLAALDNSRGGKL